MNLIELDKFQYENFVKKHPKSHFLQSYAWGEFSKKKKNLIPYYLGLMENDKIVSACLLLQKKLPFHYSYFYSPRGFVIDFNNKNLVTNMTKEVIQFIKKKKGIFLTIDPDIILEKTNYLEEIVPFNDEPKDILNTLISLGFKHKGFTKNFETMQPRYTFRIDMNQSLEEIEAHFSKTTKQRISKANKLQTEVVIGDDKDIDTFYHLMTLTEDRKDFVSYTKDYYETLYQIFDKENMVKLFLGRIHFSNTIHSLESELDKLDIEIKEIGPNPSSKNAKNKLKNLTIQMNKMKEEIKKYKKYSKEYGDVLYLNAHMIIIYQEKAWVLYAGNHNILTESYSNYKTYQAHIEYCKNHDIKMYDQFGTIGDFSKDNPRLGLHEFKKKFGGDYIEFLGEFDYIINPFLYFIFKKLVPFYRKIVFKRNKNHLKEEVQKNYKK